MQYGVNPKFATYVHREHLRGALSKLFPDTSVEVNAGPSELPFDAWIPSQNLCFEIQDPHQYLSTWVTHKSLQKIHHNDPTLNNKLSSAIQNDANLVVIPCWWDGSTEGLAATIQFHRPDLEFEKPQPIPLNPPLGFFMSPELPGVGELMLPSQPLDIKSMIHSTNWWMGENYDGIRACWNPQTNTMYTRSGREVQLTPQLTNRLPKSFLDGEFWFGRGQFASACFLTTGSPATTDYRFMRFIARDNPASQYSKLPYEERYKLLLAYTFMAHPFIQVSPKVLLQGHTHLIWDSHYIASDGGEGVILQKLRSKYEHGQSASLLNIKATKSDSDALVVSKDHKNTLVMQLLNGHAVAVPASHIYISMPEVGQVVSYFHEDPTIPGLPPVVYRVRNDVSWSDLQKNLDPEWLFNTSLEAQNLTPFTRPRISLLSKRMFMEDFAKSRNLDPYLPSTWHDIPYKTLYNHKGVRAVLQEGIYHSLLQLFPTIGLKQDKFRFVFWSVPENRRKFFELYAQKHGFDPLVPDNWYSQQRANIMNTEGIKQVLAYHSMSFILALCDIFPELELDPTKFRDQQDKYRYPRIYDSSGETKSAYIMTTWGSVESRRKLFIDFAESKGFDPFNAENWHVQDSKLLRTLPGFFSVASFHGLSLRRCLIELFPEAQFDVNRRPFFARDLSNRPHKFWTERDNVRKFFDGVARSLGLDPLNPETWYNMKKHYIFQLGGAALVQNYYKGSYKKALAAIYPEVAFDNSRFYIVEKFYWQGIQAQRQFFETFAQSRKFDPLDPKEWYKITCRDILAEKGGVSVIGLYGGSLIRSLMAVFPELDLDAKQFQFTPLRYYHSIDKQKEFFENFAKQHHFDPTVAQNWFHVTPKYVTSFKGGFNILKVYGKSFSLALQAAFPNIGISAQLFKGPKSKYWRYVPNRRQYFEQVAKYNNINPASVQDWYAVPSSRFVLGKHFINRYYKGSRIQALIDAFPELPFEPFRFLPNDDQDTIATTIPPRKPGRPKAINSAIPNTSTPTATQNNQPQSTAENSQPATTLAPQPNTPIETTTAENQPSTITVEIPTHNPTSETSQPPQGDPTNSQPTHTENTAQSSTTEENQLAPTTKT